MTIDRQYIELIYRLTEFYPRAHDRHLWLHSPHPQLDGKTAMAVINDGGIDEVIAIIERLESGVYL
jgi:uncharacterized protein (DUF2384 family)